MNFKIRYYLWKLKKASAPTRIFKDSLFVKLSSDYPTVFSEKITWHKICFRYAIVSLVIIIIAGMGGTSAYAYSSPEVTDDTLLYPLKQSIEKVEEHLQTTSEKKTQFYLKQLARREAERQVLLNKNKKIEHVESKIKQVKKQLTSMVEKISTSTSEGKRLQEQVRTRLIHRRDQLQKQSNNLEEPKNKMQQSITKFRQKHPTSTS